MRSNNSLSVHRSDLRSGIFSQPMMIRLREGKRALRAFSLLLLAGSSLHSASQPAPGSAIALVGTIPFDANAVHDDRDPTVSYSGSWQRNSYSDRYAGTQSFSNKIGDTSSFNFSGTQISYIYARQANAGVAQVSIDGKVMESIDEYFVTSVGQQIATYSGLTNSAHTIVITVEQKNPQSSDQYVIVDGFIAGAPTGAGGVHDDLDPIISYSGSWQQNSYSSRYAGTQSFSKNAHDTAAFNFSGSQVTYIYARQWNLGFAEVSIDGTVEATIDEYSPIGMGLQTATYSGLSVGNHTLTIKVVGESNDASAGTYVVIDGFIGSAPTAGSSSTSTGASAPPSSGSSTPTAGASTPPGGSSTPTGGSSTPTGGSSTPTGGSSTPTGGSSTPTGGSSTPTGGSSTPTGTSPAPGSGSDLVDRGSFLPKGDCVSDDSAALQSMLNTRGFMVLPRPIGGCYLVKKTLVYLPGDFLFGESANNPTPGDPSHGVIIRLAAGSNVGLLRTYNSFESAGGGNEYMTIENIVFDGNGAEQSAELNGQALVDFRGTFIQTYLRHVMITSAFGPGLFTGSTELDNVWIFGCSTSTYSWIHNPGTAGLGALLVNQVYVEDQTTPNGAYTAPFSGGAVNNPASFAHAVWFNGMGNATINQLHCESAATCLDINDVQSLTIHGISGTRIGNPLSFDPTDQYLIRARNTNIYSLTFSAAYFDQSGSSFKGNYSRARIFGLGAGLSSNDIFETPAGKCIWPFYTWGRYDQSFSGVPYLGERPIVGNELWIQQTGTYSPNRLAIFDNVGGPDGSYAYFERNGGQINLGFSPGPWDSNELHMLQLNYFGNGNSANNVQIPGGRIQTGTDQNTDLDGELTITSSISINYSLQGYYTVHPECTATPQFDIGQNNRLWITYDAQSSFTIHFAIPTSGIVSYTCLARR